MRKTADCRLVVFDIDGTLLTVKGMGRRALSRALAAVLGEPDPIAGVSFFGVADGQVIEQAYLQRLGRPPAPGEFAAACDSFEKAMREESVANRADAEPVPGAPELLARLSADQRIYLSLATGNLRATGRIKLALCGLDRFFPVGGFADDAAERAEILRAAIDHAEKHYGVGFPPRSIAYVGDTSSDLLAARALGVRAISVLTVYSDRDRIHELAPDAVFAGRFEVAAFYRALQLPPL